MRTVLLSHTQTTVEEEASKRISPFLVPGSTDILNFKPPLPYCYWFIIKWIFICLV